MKKIIQSRGDQLDMQIIRDSGNIYSTIYKAIGRTYRLRKGAPTKLTDPISKYSDPFNTGVITALLEIQNGLQYN